VEVSKGQGGANDGRQRSEGHRAETVRVYAKAGRVLKGEEKETPGKRLEGSEESRRGALGTAAATITSRGGDIKEQKEACSIQARGGDEGRLSVDAITYLRQVGK